MTKDTLTLPNPTSLKNWLIRLFQTSSVQYIGHPDKDTAPQQFRDRNYGMSDVDVLLDRIYTYKECTLVFHNSDDEECKAHVVNELYEEGVRDKILKASEPDTYPAPVHTSIVASSDDVPMTAE